MQLLQCAKNLRLLHFSNDTIKDIDKNGIMYTL